MSDTPFEIHDDEINVEEIMEMIRNNIRRRKEAGLLPPDPPDFSHTHYPDSASGSTSDYSRDLAYLTGNWDVQNTSYSISSHRPFAGRLLVKGRTLIHGEVRRYVDPMIWKQAEFNRNTASALESVTGRLTEIENHLREQESLLQQQRDDLAELLLEKEQVLRDEFSAASDQLESRMNEFMNEFLFRFQNQIEEEVNKQVKSTLFAMDNDIENKAWLARVLEERRLKVMQGEKGYFESGSIEPPASPSPGTDLNYFVFEETFRGSRHRIKNQQSAFTRYFEGCRNVLDIGCGRGEFLEIMREQGVGAHGVDLDETMVDYCRMRGLDVEYNDAVTYLEQLEDASLDGIFIDQVVEHLEPGYLIRLLQLCHQKMMYGFYLVAETVNPLSFTSLANFYVDPTHVRPVHPETLRFLMESCGFRELELQFLSPISEENRLQKGTVDPELSEMEQHRIEVYNKNIEMLNAILYGAQDYVLVGKK